MSVPPVGAGLPLVVVGVAVPDFGRYLSPVAAQLEEAPTGFVAIKVPVCTEPLT